MEIKINTFRSELEQKDKTIRKESGGRKKLSSVRSGSKWHPCDPCRSMAHWSSLMSESTVPQSSYLYNRVNRSHCISHLCVLLSIFSLWEAKKKTNTKYNTKQDVGVKMPLVSLVYRNKGEGAPNVTDVWMCVIEGSVQGAEWWSLFKVFAIRGLHHSSFSSGACRCPVTLCTSFSYSTTLEADSMWPGAISCHHHPCWHTLGEPRGQFLFPLLGLW